MHSITRVIRKVLLYVTALVLVAGYPLAAMADTQDPTTTPVDTTQQAPASDPAPSTPAPDPTTTTPPPAPKLNYTYNPTTGHWDSEKWVYNPATGTYEAPPAPTIIGPTSPPGPTGTQGPGTNTPTNNSATDQTTNATTGVTADNNLTGNATSGDSTVGSNTAAGNATTGNAADMANLLNVVNSTVSSGDNQKVATFTQNIMGDVNGDIMLYPMLLKAMLESQAGANDSSTISAKDNLQLNNNVDLNAKSGNAAVTNNTSAGNATTGSAAAVANVVNILNSMIATQQSFIGTINIYGNLNGDILIAPDFIPQMIANNAEAASTSNAQLSNTDSTNIVNNISAVAKSGAAAVLNNTTAGDATTGNANTGVVIFNLTGHQVIAKNSLLVFVNVLGKWVGVIVDAPVGATAALIGNGVTTDNTTYAPDLTVNSESTHGIVNTISVNAQSGDATVSGNTMAGGATSGSAVALANVANLSNSQFGITDWFGVLFINVFQNWYGSFGVNTLYGNEIESTHDVPSGPVQFIPKSEMVKSTKSHNSNSVLAYVNNQLASDQVSQGDTTTTPVSTPEDTGTLGKSTTNTSLDNGFDYRLFIIAGSVLAVGLSLLGLKRLFS
jgi:hypothetical protein